MPTAEQGKGDLRRAAFVAALLTGSLSIAPVAAFPQPHVVAPAGPFECVAIAPIRVEDAFYPPLPPNAVRPARGEFAEDNGEPDTTGDARTR